jgi:hypothetical protein
LTRNINYCQDDYFWNLKFGHDELPILTTILPTTFSGWRKEYIKVENAADKAFDVLSEIKNNAIVLNYNDQQMNFKKILSPKLRAAIYNFTPKYQSFDQIGIRYSRESQHYFVKMISHIALDNVIIDVDDLYDILTIIFYHYPNMTYEYKSVKTQNGENEYY